MSDKKRPTYEEKLKALKESIEHWENDVVPIPENADVGVLNCPCCILDDKYGDACKECFIADKTGKAGCFDTPYIDFIRDRTKENALTEVVFLSNLYIEMLESGGKKEKKKEEWVDITETVAYIPWSSDSDGDGYFWIGLHYESEKFLSHFGYVNNSGFHICDDSKKDYRLEIGQRNHIRILKKQ